MIKRALAVLLMFACSAANAQFVSGQVLTAEQLNSVFSTKTNNVSAAITGGTISGLSVPLPVASGGTGATTGTAALTGLGAGTMATQNANAVAITGGTITGLTAALPVASGGTGATTATGSGNAVLATSPTVSGLTVTGSLTATGLVTLADHATQAANTVLANVTGSVASPTAFPMPSCSAAGSAVNYTSGTGWACATGLALTSGTLAQFAATTSAQLAGVLSDETGTGVVVFSASPALTGTPTAPTATAGTSTTQLATTSFVATSFAPLASPTFTGIPAAPTAAAGTATTQLATTAFVTTSPTINQPTINGITSGANGAAGAVGQCISSTIASGSAVSLTNNTAANVTSISVTAGDWFIFGALNFNAGATTTITYIAGSASTTTASLNSGNLFLVSAPGGGSTTITGNAIPMILQNITSTTTYFLVAQAAFGTSTLAAFGNITACRWH